MEVSSNQPFRSRVVFSGPGRRPGQQPAALPPGASLRPELADVGRLWRRMARRVLGAARADEAPSAPRALAEHLGPQVTELPVVGDTWPPFEHVNLQVALDHWLAVDGRTYQLLGLTGFQNRMFSLGDLTQPMTAIHGPGIGSVSFESLPSGPDGQTMNCVRCGLYLIEDGSGRSALLFREEAQHGPRSGGGISIEMLSAEPGRASQVLAELRQLALENSVFRNQILSFDREMFGPGSGLLAFQDRPRMRREDLILPAGTLEMTEAQVLGIATHRQRLAEAGQHLKRGVLLHGPPGTGKTHTVRYLLSRCEGMTVILLSGSSLGMVGPACSIARALQPSLIVVEDVDLIAEQRGMHPGQHPLLFQLLNEMDGLGADVDVAFVLTTNRPDLLEPALANRPGRVDQAVEIPLPDAAARRRLIQLYRGNLDLSRVDVGPAVSRTEGVTASFIKELLRRAALIRASSDGPSNGQITLTSDDLGTALDHLLDERNRLTRVLLGGNGEDPSPSGGSTDARDGN